MLFVDAIASYERTLLTPSRFDKYLNGDTSMLNETERAGYQAFINYGCASCHQGTNIGGNMYSRFGVMEDYFKERTTTEADLGRYNVTHREEDRYVFKVPSLRNVAVTPPYFHNGLEQSLEKAIKIMGRFQLGRELPEHDIVAIAAFLCTLTGEWEGHLLK
jgi:cytochrome c peroxidase